MNRVAVYFRDLLLGLSSRTNRSLKIIFDILVIPVAMIIAVLLRFEWTLPAEYLKGYQLFAVQSVTLSILLFYIFGAYSEMWVYWSFRDLKRLMLIHSAVVCAIFIENSLFHLFVWPRSLYLLYWGIGAGLLSSARIAARMLMMASTSPQSEKKRILIIGAGCTGEMLARQVIHNQNIQYRILGFLDDTEGKQGRTIHGFKVLGKIADLPRVSKSTDIDEVIIAIPSATSKEMQTIVSQCEKAGVNFRTVPGPNELVDGNFSMKDLRKVNLNDLLGREQHPMDIARVSSLINRQVVLVTGAAGSIGSELCRQIAKFNPKTIVALDKDENGIFYLNNELENQCHFKPVVTQIQNVSKLRYLFEMYQPSIVFHAAAYKHVPCMEWYPEEAIINNYEGLMLLADVCDEYKVLKFVQISTDKAVYPSNMMGASKRLCELYIKHLTRMGHPGYCTVRFGNVIGSQGSVLTVFEKQIKERKPITVTHPDMERYFMSIQEACRLVLEAAALGQGGGTYLLDMGEPIRIAELARQMIILSGLKPGKDIRIVYGSIRPGEKLHEKLWYDYEKKEKTANSKIFRLISESPLHERFEGLSHELINSARDLTVANMLVTLCDLVPEFMPTSDDLRQLECVKQVQSKVVLPRESALS